MLFSSFHALKRHTDFDPTDINVLRHIILNCIRSYKKKLSAYPLEKIVIACDSQNSWRREVFPYYKHSRKVDRSASGHDWTLVFRHFNEIKQEIKDRFAYILIEIDRLEADDVIAALAISLGNSAEKIIIVSADKDFSQLQKYTNISQYDQLRKRWIRETHPDLDLRTHIIRGDATDGIPNILSPDDCFVNKQRQRTITTSQLDEWISENNPQKMFSEQVNVNWCRNKLLIDLEQCSPVLHQKVLESYKSQVNKKSNDLFGYFVQHKLKELLPMIGEF